MAVKPDEVLDLERRGVLNNGVFKVFKGNEEDPDIDRKIVIEGDAAVRGDADGG